MSVRRVIEIRDADEVRREFVRQFNNIQATRVGDPHECRVVRVGSVQASIDLDLADLIESICQKTSWTTQWSCQQTSWWRGDMLIRDYAYIVFEKFEDACSFTLETSKRLHKISNKEHHGQSYEKLHIEPFNPPWDDINAIRGVVRWPSYMTDKITEVWTK